MLAGVLAVAHDHALGGALDHDLHKLAVVLDVLLESALLDLVERRLGDVDVVALDQFRHMAEEEGEQQRANVRAVDVGIGHEDDLAVANLGRVEVVFADAAAERGDHGADFFVAQHLVVAGLLDVEDLALEGQDGLEAAVAALLGGAAGAFALDQVEFAAVGVAFAAVSQLAGQTAAIERALAARQVAGLAGGFACTRGFDGLVDDACWRRAGFCSRNMPRRSLTKAWTMPAMSELSLPLVCPSNCGCESLTLTTATRPSRTSSPLRFSFKSLKRPS